MRALDQIVSRILKKNSEGKLMDLDPFKLPSLINLAIGNKIA